MFELHKDKAREFLHRQASMRGFDVTERWLWPCKGTVTIKRGATPIFEVRFEFDDARQTAEIVRLEGRASSRASQTYCFRHDDRRSKDHCITAMLGEFEAHFRSFPERVRASIGDGTAVDADDFHELDEDGERFFAERAEDRVLVETDGRYHLVSIFGDRYSGWVTVAGVTGVGDDEVGGFDLANARIDLENVEYVPDIDSLKGYLEAEDREAPSP